MINLQDVLKNKKPVNPDRLFEVIKQADRLVVIIDTPDEEERKVVFETSDKRYLLSFSESLALEIPEEEIQCFCEGDPWIRLYSGDELLTAVANHHGDHVSCSLWDTDAEITDIEKWLLWFDAIGIDSPRNEVESNRKEGEKNKRAMEKWITAMPKGTQFTWESAQEGNLVTGDSFNIKPIREALDKSIPAKNEQILALITWYGSGMGSWELYPSYEGTAESLLMGNTLEEIVKAINVNTLTNHTP